MTGLTDEQKIILEEFVKDDFLRSNFYFSGGTALSSVYLHHRISEDLDFFVPQKFDQLTILNKITAWGAKHNFEITPLVVEDTYIFNLSFPNHNSLKIDFSYYPYKRLKTGKKINNIDVDSLQDIATNKLITVNQRTEVKDFVDLYFLLKDFSVWDLIEAVRLKFRVKLDILNLAADFLKVEEFEFLPNMLLPLTLEELKEFYQQQAKKLGYTIVEQ